MRPTQDNTDSTMIEARSKIAESPPPCDSNTLAKWVPKNSRTPPPAASPLGNDSVADLSIKMRSLI